MIGNTLGPYQIISKLGAGGMGEVYRAKDTRLDRDVAVKVLPPGSVGDAQAEARFNREARAIAGISHPNICALFDVGRVRPDEASAGQEQEVSYLVMELLEGETLHQRLQRGPLGIGVLVDHAINLADALDLAHTRGMLHRDLKPANLFLTSRGQIKVLDFGLAKALDADAPADVNEDTRLAEEPLTGIGIAVGSMGYMSPEQLRGESVDARSDLFALGVVIYEMATGQRAFQGSTGAVVSHAILGGQPVAPRSIRPDLPVTLEGTILKALEKDRDVRCQTAAEMRADLKRVKRDLAGGVSSTADVSIPATRIPKPTATAATAATATDSQLAVDLVKRHRLKALLAILGIAAAIVAGVWFANLGTSAPPAANPAVPLQIQPVTFTGNTLLGALSPDGKFVAYLRREPQDAVDMSLWVRQLTSESDVQIVPVVPGRTYVGLAVTPDGSYVDFVAQEKGVTQPDLWRVPFLGGTPRRIVTSVWSATGWAPDGKHMAFIRTKAGGSETESSVVVADADGSNERIVLTRQPPARLASTLSVTVSIARPSWSSDGRSLLVLGSSALPERQGRSAELVLIDVESGTETRAVPLEKISHIDAAWVDDRYALVHGILPGRTQALYRADLETGSLVPVTQDIAQYYGVGLTADRQAAVSTRIDFRSGIWVGDGAGGSMTEVVPEGSGSPLRAALDRSGGLVYHARTTSGFGVFAINPGQRTPSLVLDNAIEPHITSDGKTIVAQSLDTPGLFRVNADGTGKTTIVEGHVARAILLPDDRTVVYLSNRSGIQSLWSVPIAGGPSRELLHRFIASNDTFSASPNGRWLKFGAGVVDGRSVRMMCDMPDCTNLREFTARPGRWTPDSLGVSWVDSGDRKNIWVQAIAGGPPRTLTKFTEKMVQDYAWSPDGKRLAVTRTTQLADMVLIKGIR